MAQGIPKGSPKASRFLEKTLSPQHQGIERGQYPERTKLAGNLLKSPFDKQELHDFQKTEFKQIKKVLPQRETRDRTRTVEAIEYKAEAMLNAFKTSQVEGRRFIKNAFNYLVHIQDVFKGVDLADIQSIKNPLLQSLASLKRGYGNKKDAAASFASQVLSNPTYLFADLRQAKFFLSRFLRKHRLSGISRMLRRRSYRAQQNVMKKLQGYNAAFRRSIKVLPKLKRAKKPFVPSLYVKDQKSRTEKQIVGSQTQMMSRQKQEEQQIASRRDSELVVPVLETISPLSVPGEQLIKKEPPQPPTLSTLQHSAIQNSAIKLAEHPMVSDASLTRDNAIPKAPPFPGVIKPEDVSLDELEQMVADVGPVYPISNAAKINPSPVQTGAMSIEDLDAMLGELEDLIPLPFNTVQGQSQLKTQLPENLQPAMVFKPLPALPSTTDEKLDRLFSELGGGDAVAANFNRDEEALNRLLAELEDLEQPYKPGISKLAQGQSDGNTVPPPPPSVPMWNGKAFVKEGPAHPSQGNPVNGNHDTPDAPPLPGSLGIAIPPPPPPPPLLGAAPQPKPAGSRARVAAEGIKTLNELVPVKPADHSGKGSMGQCEIAPQDMPKVQESVFRDLTIDKIKAFSPEQIASLTEEQQKAMPTAVIHLIVARAMQAPSGLTAEQREEPNIARKALACLDPRFVREKLEHSPDLSHQLYIQPKFIQGRPTDDLNNLYKSIRREVFHLPYKPGEALSRLSPEQLAESQAKQKSLGNMNTQDLFSQIHAGKELKKTVPLKEASEQHSMDSASSPENTKEKAPKVGDGAVFNDDLLNKGMHRGDAASMPSQQPSVDIPEADAGDWEDDEEQDADEPKTDHDNSSPAGSNKELGQAEAGTRDKLHPNIQPEAGPMPERPEVAIAEAATQAVQIAYKMRDIQKNVDLAAAVEQAVEAMVQVRRDEKMQALSDAELKQLSGNLESIALAFYREKQKEWMKAAQIAARKAAQDAAAEAIRLKKSQEETQATAQQAAQVAAEKAVMKAIATAVKDHNGAQINALIKSNHLGSRRRAVEEDDESNNTEDDDDFWA